MAASLQISRAAEVELTRRLDSTSSHPIAVALSGGGDSLALFHIAAAFGKKTGRPILALTVNHGLHPQSKAWSDAARTAALSVGAEWRGLDWRGEKPKTGLAAAARRARHALLAEAARSEGCKVLLIGHTADDQAENIWMRQNKLAPFGELSSWSPSPVWPEGRGVFLCRPLLSLRRAALRETLLAQGQTWVEDPANTDIARPRARARRALGLAKSEVPVLPESRDLAPSPLIDAFQFFPFGAAEVPLQALLAAHEATRTKALAAALVGISGREAIPDGARVRNLVAALSESPAGSRTLGGAKVSRYGDTLLLTRDMNDRRTPRPDMAGLFEARFSLSPAVTACAAHGRLAALTPADRQRIKALNANIRPTLPIVLGEDGVWRLPQPFGEADVMATSLAQGRFRAALGGIVTERDIETP